MQSPPEDVREDSAESVDDTGQLELPSFPDTGSDVADANDVGSEPDADEDGEVGDPCQQNSDCLSEYCLFFDPAAPTGFCSEACADAEDCPDGWVCATFTDTGSDAVMRCIQPGLCLDSDGDGYGEGPGCVAPDCDDTRGDISPLADEVCNALDDDCDTRIDDNPIDERRACETGFVGRCAAGQTVCADGLLECVASAASGEDICDGVDNDCDGLSDEDNVCDGVACCYLERCEGVCDTARRNGDGTCVAPPGYASEELCDGLDNDCDGQLDEGVTETFYVDADNDGFGTATTTEDACTRPVGFSDNDDDCDDAEPTVSPASTEVCDSVDNDCDGDTDSGVCAGLPCCWNDICEGICGTALTGTTGRCEAPEAFGTEVCDGVDNDCDGSVDEDLLGLFYPDADRDTWGDRDAPGLVACTAPTGFVANQDDCDDQISGDFPGATERCDGRDNNCNDSTDESFELGAACSAGTGACFVSGSVVCSDDALSTQCSASEGTPTTEQCDGRDNDCDGETDELNPGGGVACNTGELGICALGTSLCRDSSLVCVRSLAPAPETCDGFDNNCDGRVDEGNPQAGLPCNTGLSGVCGQGVSICSGGELSCLQTGFPAAETCDNRDNNCDGQIDEGNPGSGIACVTGLLGACSLGVSTCQAGSPSCAVTTSPTAEVCDGVDNDCDGTVDEGNPGAGLACSTGLAGPCGAGITACSGSAVVCQQTTFASLEICDGRDNDCDAVVDEATTCANCTQRNNGGRSYLFCGRRFQTWNSARDACAALGDYRLVSIGDGAENEWVRSTLVSLYPPACEQSCIGNGDGICTDGGFNSASNDCEYATDCSDCGFRGAPANFWIGFNDQVTEGNFQWVSGVAVTYTNWPPAEPNDLNGEDCTEVRTESGLWNDEKCTDSRVVRPWVCESL